MDNTIYYLAMSYCIKTGDTLHAEYIQQEVIDKAIDNLEFFYLNDLLDTVWKAIWRNQKEDHNEYLVFKPLVYKLCEVLEKKYDIRHEYDILFELERLDKKVNGSKSKFDALINSLDKVIEKYEKEDKEKERG